VAKLRGTAASLPQRQGVRSGGDPFEAANCGNYVRKRPADAVLKICCASSDSLYCYKNDGRITLWKFEGSGKFSL